MYSYLSKLLNFEFTICFVIFGIIYLIRRFLEYRKLPNGPYGVPIFGYSLFLSNKPHLDITALSKKYGNIFSLKLGPSNVVFLNDWESVKDALSKDEFLGRPKRFLGTTLFQNERNVLTESGAFWKNHRRFAFKLFCDLGFGKQVMESNIKDEISYLLKEIDFKIEDPIKIQDLLIPSVSNNICYFIFGHRFEYDDPMRKKMDFLLEPTPESFQVTKMVAKFDLITILSEIIGRSQLKQEFDKSAGFEKLIDEEITKRESRMDGDEIRDYFDAYLVEMKRRKDDKDALFTRSALNSNSRGFFSVGSDTLRTSLEWLLKLIAEHKHIQKAVQKEVDDVVGHDRLPSWSDRELMPFTEAVILEMFRWVSLVPLNVPRRAMRDSTILGHFIPKDTLIVANFWAINRDPKHWDNPEEFNPYRFLTEDNRLKKCEVLTPFSYGKRNCVGDIMAKCELFLYLTILMQNYEINVPKGVQQTFDSWLAITMQPKQFPVLTFTKRLFSR